MNIFYKNPIKRKQHVLAIIDCLIVIVVFLSAYIFRIVIYESGSIELLWGRLSWLVMLAVLWHVLSFYIFELYNIEIKKTNIYLFFWISISVFLAVGLIAISSYVFPHAKLGRVLISIHVPILIVFVFLWRKLFYAIFLKRSSKRNLLLIGGNHLDGEIVNLLEKHSMTNYKLTEIISEHKENSGFIDQNGALYCSDLKAVVKEKNIKTIVIAKKITQSPSLKEQLIDLKFKGIEIYDFPTFYKRLKAKVPIFQTDEDGILFDCQDKTFNPPLYLNLKRVFDVLLATFGIVASVPFLLMSTIAIKLTSKGPIIFKQERLGLNEIPFILLKFRTMFKDAEMDTGPIWSKPNDQRITRVGRILRKSRIDEIPQLINILKGDMSFVGPRPIRKHFAESLGQKYPYYRLRFSVKPGITGWAQVRGDYAGSESGQLEKLEYELFYIQNQSLFLDLFIVLKTIQTILFRYGQ